jgi:hypothetical protein
MKAFFKTSLIILIFLSSSFELLSQGNTPCTATTINSNTTCVNTAGTTASLTYQNDAANAGTPSCASPGAPDGWYSFTPTVTATYTIDLTAGGITDSGMSIYTNSSGCSGTFTQVECDDDDGAGTMSQIIRTLTAGTTYFIRVWRYSSGTGTFSICIVQGAAPPSAPANDNCTGATVLSVSSGTACTTLVGGTVLGATTSTNSNTCGGTADDDVWYSFVATSTSHSVTISNIAGSNTDMYHSVYAASGGCNSIGAPLVCSDPNISSISGLTIGATYFVRAYTWTSTTGQNTTFSVCVTTPPPPPPPPSNDNPCNATAVTVNPSLTCTSQSNGSVVGATSSTVGLGSCFGTADDDVWYSFVATSTSHNISLNNVAGSTTDMYHSVHPGPCGAIGAALVCSDPNNSTVTGLTVGTTYFIRVYTWTSTTGQTSTFSVCVTTPPPPPPPPSNDNPCNAISVTVNPSLTCTSQSNGSVIGATTSTVGLGSCFGTADDDVWYSFVATSTSHNISLNNVAGSTTDMYHSVHPGPCGAIGAALVCSDPNNSTVTGLTIGTTYFIRVYTWTSTAGQTSTFSVCVTTPTPPGPPSSNVDCLGSTPICGNASFSGNSSGEGVEEINGTNQGCISFSGEQQSSWYTFKILTGGTLSFTLTTSVDYDFAIWGAYSSTSTAANICPVNTAPVRCSFAATGGNTGLGNGAVDNSETAGGDRWVAPMNVTASQVYEMLINNFAADLSSFTLTWGGTAVLDCSVILPIELISFTATNYGNFNRVNWSLSSDIYDDYFVLEHSYDGVNFSQIDTIRVLTNNNEIKSYNLKDYKIKETTYYRLKQVKKNKSFLYSKIISAQSLNENDKIIKIYPNPTKDQINVDVICKDKNDIKISLIDNFGNEYFVSITGVDSGQSSLLINLNNFDAGIYLLKVTFEKSGKTEIQKIIKN